MTHHISILLDGYHHAEHADHVATYSDYQATILGLTEDNILYLVESGQDFDCFYPDCCAY